MKYITIAISAITGGIVVGLYAVNKTVDRLENVLNPKVACLQKQVQYIYSTSSGDEEFKETRPWEVGQWDKQNDFPSLKFWFERKIKGLSWRLLEMISTAETVEEKVRIIKILKSWHLDDSDYQQLAQQCNSSTAAFLAREPDIDLRFFLTPPKRKECFDKTCLLGKFHDLFVQLQMKHHHWCLGYFISRIFRNSLLNYWLKDFEYLAFECVISPITVTHENVIILCVESLLHHVMLKDNIHAMVEARGLEILLDACRFMPDSLELKLHAVKILMKVSSNPRYLNDIHVTGWLKVLVAWSRECDQRLSSPAASALSNLERSSTMGSCFQSEVCLLHPFHRNDNIPQVDVIIVHGLLGSAHSTWKQRNKLFPSNLPLREMIANEVDGTSSVETYCTLCSTVINDIPRSIVEEQNEEMVEKDYEFILADIPISESQANPEDILTIPGSDPRIKQASCSCCGVKSQCWPKDWLPKDYKKLRILGVDYSSRITDWTNWCPHRYCEEKARLSERSRIIMEQLIECGVGDRPIIWIGHSMGGLIIKHMLQQAKLQDTYKHTQLLKNSKSVFFLGTPHFGSPAASIRKYLTPFLPSPETKELEINSPGLLHLHECFSQLVEMFSIQVVSFNETKGAKLTVPPLEWELNCISPILSDVGTGAVYEIPVGHVDISKLSTPLSFIYTKVLQAIKNAVDEKKV